jgi:hypothetical protein
MTFDGFCWWLKGHFELEDTAEGLSARQVQIIKDHLDLVFNKVTPDRKPFNLDDPICCYRGVPQSC